jgi:hypothetical protein
MIWKNVGREKFCKECYGKSKTGVAKKPKPTATPIPAMSSKMAKKKALYSIARVKFLETNSTCQLRIPGKCSLKATEVHHTAGRVEELLLDTRYWKSGCRGCHDYVELHPEIAKEMGLSIDRLTLEKNENIQQEKEGG